MRGIHLAITTYSPDTNPFTLRCRFTRRQAPYITTQIDPYVAGNSHLERIDWGAATGPAPVVTGPVANAIIPSWYVNNSLCPRFELW